MTVRQAIRLMEDDGWPLWAPDLPGCVATGDDIEECARNLREAIAFHLEGLEDAGEPAPEPSSGAGVFVAHAA